MHNFYFENNGPIEKFLIIPPYGEDNGSAIWAQDNKIQALLHHKQPTYKGTKITHINIDIINHANTLELKIKIHVSGLHGSKRAPEVTSLAFSDVTGDRNIATNLAT